MHAADASTALAVKEKILLLKFTQALRVHYPAQEELNLMFVFKWLLEGVTGDELKNPSTPNSD